MLYDEYGNPKPDVGGLTTLIFIGIFKIIYYGFVYLPIWAASYFLTMKLNPFYGESKPIKIVVVFLIAYILYCFVFFLKGLMIAFKVNKKWLWVPLFVVCVLFTCLLPTWLSFDIIKGLLRPEKGHVVKNRDYWSALFAVIVGGLIYNKYKFHTDICPRMAFWAYSIGFNSMLTFIDNHIDNSPDKGREFL